MKAEWVGQSSPSAAAPAIDHSDTSAVTVLFTSAAVTDDIERRLWIVMPEATGVYANHKKPSLRLQRAPRGYAEARCAVLFMLSVALVTPLPSLAALVGTKSGSKRIFAAANVNAFPSIYDLFDPSLLPLDIAAVEACE
ncbi:uncharacterized protein MONOS_11109 [Monocercomonoides exilis]|uniref:uncharacterized protein n=1 Tax=Monocercomonoides exilis TaxID=2049356 RepID=UPI003559906A|nr:hypothetical protein MONOS_11109 [Monocercomonoides exilis]|eukprot:MONOS_11109.1-p1 / transcript=MONOS_11109.1 / gene=MONOS_11109 / organism=Monocercomonoides_exilis_PA203 / gene_product=unspecified product / transcript_product=unspecified product / location=Mono_scaffold00539:14464-14923(+) / protein_length=139 / sequence_SO=supercontig / SO=protein_coding / is_pseudo=false